MKDNKFFSIGVANALEIDAVCPADRYQYALCAELWISIAYDLTDVYTARELESAINAFGLEACIASADSFAERALVALEQYGEKHWEWTIHGCDGPEPLFSLGDWEITIPTNGVNHIWCAIISSALESRDRMKDQYAGSVYRLLFDDCEAVALSAICQIVLRFPKRYTTSEPDVAAGLHKFREVHKETRALANDWSRWPGRYLIEHVKRNLREILIPKNPLVFKSILKRYMTTPGRFSSGSIYLNQVDVGFCPEKADDVWRYNAALRAIQSSYRDDEEHRDEVLYEGTVLYVPKYDIEIEVKKNTTIEQILGMKPKKMPKWENFSAVTSKIPAVKWGSLGMDSDYLYTHASLYGYFPPVTVKRTPFSSYVNSDGHMQLRYPAYRKRDVYVMPVPKDYKDSRMIAPETAYLNVEGDRVRSLLLDLVKATGFIQYMPPEDQSLNRDRAREGSIAHSDNPYCTYDLSHASDSIVRAIFFEVLPIELHAIVRDAISDYMLLDADLVRTAMLATSGSKLTPVLQSCFFLALLFTGCDLCNEPRDVSVYNDDLICRRNVAATIEGVLTSFGLTVNRKKSFVFSPFRESCGGEYINGIEVTGVYWPRKTIVEMRPKARKVTDPVIKGGDPINSRGSKVLESLQHLIALQHKLFYFPTARMVLERRIKVVVPDMTFSPVGSESDDLWAEWMDELLSMRSGHYKFVSKIVNRGRNSIPDYLSEYYNVGSQLMEFYSYTEWLRKGPEYPDALCSFLHVASIPGQHAQQEAVIRLAKERPAIADTQ